MDQKRKSWFDRLIEWVKARFFARELEIALVGLQNAGKTTLVNTMATGQFEEDTIPTIGFNHRSLRKGKVQMKLWDLGGQVVHAAHTLVTVRPGSASSGRSIAAPRT